MNRFIALFFALTIGVSAMQLSDVVVDSTSIRAMGRGGAVVAAPYGADSLTTNPAGLAQQGSGVHYYNMDFEENVSNKSTSILYHRESFGAGQWGFENNALMLIFLVLVMLKKVVMVWTGDLIIKPLMSKQPVKRLGIGRVTLV